MAFFNSGPVFKNAGHVNGTLHEPLVIVYELLSNARLTWKHVWEMCQDSNTVPSVSFGVTAKYVSAYRISFCH